VIVTYCVQPNQQYINRRMSYVRIHLTHLLLLIINYLLSSGPSLMLVAKQMQLSFDLVIALLFVNISVLIHYVIANYELDIYVSCSKCHAHGWIQLWRILFNTCSSRSLIAIRYPCPSIIVFTFEIGICRYIEFKSTSVCLSSRNTSTFLLCIYRPSGNVPTSCSIYLTTCY